MKSKTYTISKWKKGVAAGAPAYKDGVTHPTRDWATATAASADKWASGVQTAAANGHFARGVNAQGVDQKWKNNTQGKGATRWASSVQDPNTVANYTKGVDKMYTIIDAGLAAIANMPSTTQADRDARMLAYVQATRAAKAAQG